MKNTSKIKGILKIIKPILIVLSIWVTIHLCGLLYVGLFSEVKKSDAILILGNTVETSGIPSMRLKGRLDKGIELYQNNLAPIIIVSGGYGIEGFNEAIVMKNYLVEHGVKTDNIIVDENGNTTYLTTRNLVPIAKEKNIKSIIVVSQYYHLLRAKRAVEITGIKEVYVSPGNSPFEIRDFYSIPREIIAYYYYLLRT